MNRKLYNGVLVTVLLAVCAPGCSENPSSTPPDHSKQLFLDQETENYSVSFSGRFPSESPGATAIASGASGKGQFSVDIACDAGGSLSLKIDDSTSHNIECDGKKNSIRASADVASTGEVKLNVSSGKQDGTWKIQLVGSKP
ncbi:hypothetical protein [Kocuria massiliensis]|uniref:hypothetical protein n=1 Tax=Kocuria massiliensis TaxID=1926282 RepID=UPI0022B9A7D4|nr:hypothetical protein [Kocuria massiliensis]